MIRERSFDFAGNNFLSSTIVSILFFVLCIFVGKSVTVLPYYIPIILVFSICVFFIGFTYTNLAIILLLLAMLLSPEIALGAVSSSRNVVIRIEDLLIILFSLAWLARTTIQKNILFITPTPINRYISFYIIIFFISTVKGMIIGQVKPLQGFFFILKYIEYFFVFFIALGIIQTKKQLKLYLKAIIVTFAIVAVYGATQLGSGRVSAPFEGNPGEPNTLGGYQVLIFGVILGVLTHLKETKWRIPLILLTVFSLLPFLNTLSRSSYMSFIPMYLTIIFFTKTKRRNILIGAMLCVIVISIFAFPKNVKERIKYTFTPQATQHLEPVKVFGVTLGPSASERVKSWMVNFEKWKKRPIIGYGVTAVGFIDSQYVRTFVELGAVGLSAFLLLLGSLYTNTLRIYKNTQDDLYKGLALGFLAGHIGMLFHAITANTYIIIRIMEPYWFLAAMVMIIPRLEKKQLELEKPKKDETIVDKMIERDQLRMEYLRNSHQLLKYNRP
ncbi:MAG: O-antigen ligase family protein [Candidatus Omnitrophica bacterium]|nr:O-antigen ligase family protein [Candidatus Omnitrophota bacterium]